MLQYKTVNDNKKSIKQFGCIENISKENACSVWGLVLVASQLFFKFCA